MDRIRKYAAYAAGLAGGKTAVHFVYPLILFLWPFAPVRAGLSVMDTGYSLANYRYPGSVTHMWYYATFLAQKTGEALMHLPFGDRMLGISAYAAAFVSLMALAGYFVLGKVYDRPKVFAGEFLAVSLFWCPPVILYNTCTDLLLTFACLLLILSVRNQEKERTFLFAAGIFLGLNVTVRFSNAAEAALIAAVWYACLLSKESFQDSLRKTLLCVAGFVLGAGAGILAACMSGGVAGYFAMIGELFSSTSAVESYTFGGMLAATASAWMQSLRWVLFLLAAAAGLTVWYFLPVGKGKIWKTVCAAVFLLVVLRFLWGRGMFTLNYRDYWCWFAWGMVFLDITAVLALLTMAGVLEGGKERRFTACLVLVLLLVIPLGSNNYTFPLFGCLFVIAPFGIVSACDAAKRLAGPGAGLRSVLAFAILVVFVQGIGFHCLFAFRDGTDGTAQDTAVSGVPVVEGMRTTSANAKSLEGLMEALTKEELLFSGSLIFGDAPGLHYYLSLEPALDTAWPDLDSYPYASLEQSLAQLEEKIGEGSPFPVVITKEKEELWEGAKGKRLRAFLEKYAYTSVYTDGVYELYLRRN